MKTISTADVRETVENIVADVISDYKDQPDTDRETVIERLDEECDTAWGQLVQHGRIDQYDADDLINTAEACGTILKVAKADAWVEDDRGLWEGLTYGAVASQAYFSLRNLLYNALKQAGHDTNDDLPFAAEEE